jgi:glycosyltransferase involved in cell wall biosynthesis
LQDCYVAEKLGKRPLVGHAHGSDLRVSLNHPLWGRIVKYNLRRCDKILVSTPDILSIAREFREDAEYLPNPVDMQLFYPKPIVKREKKRVLIASDSNWSVKGTDVAIRALSKIKEEVDVSIISYGSDFDRTLSLANSLGLHLRVLPKAPHEKLNQYYWDADVIMDGFKLGSFGMVSLEAIACGRPVIVYVSSEYPEYRDFPLKDLKEEEEIAEAVLNSSEELWEKEYEYLRRNHDPRIVASRVLEIYQSVKLR